MISTTINGLNFRFPAPCGQLEKDVRRSLAMLNLKRAKANDEGDRAMDAWSHATKPGFYDLVVKLTNTAWVCVDGVWKALKFEANAEQVFADDLTTQFKLAYQIASHSGKA